MARFSEVRRCALCGVEFTAHHPSAKYCSVNHRTLAHHRQKRAASTRRYLSRSAKSSLDFLKERCPQAAKKLETDLAGRLGRECVEDVLKFALIVLAEAKASDAA